MALVNWRPQRFGSSRLPEKHLHPAISRLKRLKKSCETECEAMWFRGLLLLLVLSVARSERGLRFLGATSGLAGSSRYDKLLQELWCSLKRTETR